MVGSDLSASIQRPVIESVHGTTAVVTLHRRKDDAVPWHPPSSR